MIDTREPFRGALARAVTARGAGPRVAMRRILPVVVALGLGAAGATARGQDPVQPAAPASGSRTAPAALARADQAPEVVPAGLKLLVSHHMEEGRLIVRVGGQVALSAPFSRIKAGSNGWCERPLSVESGPQTVTVQVIDGAGRLVAQRMTNAILAADGTATLAVAEHGGKGDALTLEWRTP